MSIYELRTYTLYVGKMGEAAEAYQTLGWPVFERVGEGRCLGYFTGDVGAMNQIWHIWKFPDDQDRRAFWARLYADDGFKAFAAKFRPLVMTQENRLLQSAPWGPAL